MYLSCLKERQREKRQDVFIPEDNESDNDEEEYKEIDDSSVRKREGKVQLKINKYGELSNIEQISILQVLEKVVKSCGKVPCSLRVAVKE